MNIPAAEKTIQKLFASAASNCHDWWPCFWPLEETEDVRKEGALRMWKAALIRCIISWFGRICFPHVQRIVSLNTACPHDGHWWISEVLNSMSSTLAMSWAAWVDSWLNSMLSFTGSSRIQIFFEPTISLVHFKDVFRTVLNFRWVLAFLPLSQKNSVRLCARSGMLLLALPILTQRYLARWPWSFKSFVKVLDLHHLMPHDQCNLQVLLRRSWLQTTSSARIPIQDPPLLTIVPRILHFELVSKML